MGVEFNVQRMIINMLGVITEDSLEQAGEIGRLVTTQGVKGSLGSLAEFISVIQANIGDPSDLVDAHAKIAEAGRVAMYNSYKTTRAERGGPPSYRQGDDSRLSGGMKRAMTNKKMAFGDDKGFALGNANIIKKEAAHWRRLNYGTEGARSVKHSATFRIDNVGIMTVKQTRGPSKRFRVPEYSKAGNPTSGFFNVQGQLLMGKNTSGEGVQFVQTPTQKFAKPIQPWNFFEDGIKGMRDAFPEEYKELMKAWFSKAVSRGYEFKFIDKKTLKAEFGIGFDR